MNDSRVIDRDPSNRDPITNAPGAHPVGVGIGAAVAGAALGMGTAAATGAAVGSAAGPIGTVVGAAIGAVAGGLIGKGVAEHYDPTVEDRHWRDNHASEPYYDANYSYDSDYAPAYRLGGTARQKFAGKSFDDVEGHLASEWDTARGRSSMSWEHARDATRAGWNRIAD